MVGLRRVRRHRNRFQAHPRPQDQTRGSRADETRGGVRATTSAPRNAASGNRGARRTGRRRARQGRGRRRAQGTAVRSRDGPAATRRRAQAAAGRRKCAHRSRRRLREGQAGQPRRRGRGEGSKGAPEVKSESTEEACLMDVEVIDGVSVVRLDRPPVNALDLDLVEDAVGDVRQPRGARRSHRVGQVLLGRCRPARRRRRWA